MYSAARSSFSSSSSTSRGSLSIINDELDGIIGDPESHRMRRSDFIPLRGCTTKHTPERWIQDVRPYPQNQLTIATLGGASAADKTCTSYQMNSNHAIEGASAAASNDDAVNAFGMRAADSDAELSGCSNDGLREWRFTTHRRPSTFWEADPQHPIAPAGAARASPVDGRVRRRCNCLQCYKKVRACVVALPGVD